MSYRVINPPIGASQEAVSAILSILGYKRPEIQFIQPRVGNSNLTVRYGYWKEIKDPNALDAIQDIYPDAYKSDVEDGDHWTRHTLVLINGN